MCNSPEAWMYCLKRGQVRSDVMPDFDWTGDLRPHRISPMRMVRKTEGRSSIWESGRLQWQLDLTVLI